MVPLAFDNTTNATGWLLSDWLQEVTCYTSNTTFSHFKHEPDYSLLANGDLNNEEDLILIKFASKEELICCPGQNCPLFGCPALGNSYSPNSCQLGPCLNLYHLK